MKNPITASTQIDMIVDGQKVFSICNNPEMGFFWLVLMNVNREAYNQGLYAIAEASHNIMMNKIEADTPRILGITL